MKSDGRVVIFTYPSRSLISPPIPDICSFDSMEEIFSFSIESLYKVIVHYKKTLSIPTNFKLLEFRQAWMQYAEKNNPVTAFQPRFDPRSDDEPDIEYSPYPQASQSFPPGFRPFTRDPTRPSHWRGQGLERKPGWGGDIEKPNFD
jgi:hypothetical protein